MDSVIIFILLAIGFLIVVIYFTLKKSTSTVPRTKEEKCHEIIVEYKRRLDEELSLLKTDNDAMLAKKSVLLRDFSLELSRNIFFDNDEMREVIQELANYEIK